MIRSMTGYGFAHQETDIFDAKVEIKTLNSKSQDFNIKLPKNHTNKEIEIRNLLSSKLERGKINISLELNYFEFTDPGIHINRELVKKYYEDLKATAEYAGAPPEEDLFRTALKMPDIYKETKNEEQREKEWNSLYETLEEAVKECEEFRIKEGEKIKDKLESYINNIKNYLRKINEKDPERIENIKNRIKNRVIEISESKNFDPNRFEQEMIYFIEKLDISEEKQRLETHLQHFLECLYNESSAGKKLNFISQEIGREINTTGSKANDAQIQQWVVAMKEELEKIKEQTLNIL